MNILSPEILAESESVLQNTDITILIPCLNEAETISNCIAEAWTAISDTGMTGEIIVADNGSTDRSVEIAQNAGARVVHILEKGYGHALTEGIQAAYGQYILMGDADCPMVRRERRFLSGWATPILRAVPFSSSVRTLPFPFPFAAISIAHAMAGSNNPGGINSGLI